MMNSKFISDIFYNVDSILPTFDDNNVLFVTDSNVFELFKKSKNYSLKSPFCVIEDGENVKNFNTLEKILSCAIDNKLDRNCTFVGVGGGVVTDIVGFASSIYMRGVSHILVPTTLLGMVDAAIGGKTAIDFHSYKNLIGSFNIPKAIYICEQNLKTLPKNQYFSGLGEIIKIALINRPNLYHKINNDVSFFLNCDMSIEIIKEAIEGKLQIVNEDFYEKGKRAFLNLGHTFAHALEATLEFKNITHGAAVVWGIQKALKLGEMLGKTNTKYVDEVLTIIEKLNYNENIINEKLLSISKKSDVADLLLEKMKMDKKNKNGKIRLVLQKDLNVCFLADVRDEEIKEVLF